MAKKFLDAAVANAKDDITVQDGSALTLTNAVRVLYDDTVPKLDLFTTIERILAKMREDLGG